MKGYTVGAGFMGYVEGEYILFASETDYYECTLVNDVTPTFEK